MRLEPSFRVDPGRHRLRVGEDDPIESQQVAGLSDAERRPGRDDHDQRVSEKLPPVFPPDSTDPFELVHTRRVGREEHVGRRARANLAREIARSPEGKLDGIPGRLFERSTDFLERLRQAGRGEHQDFLGAAGRRHREEEQGRKDPGPHRVAARA